MVNILVVLFIILIAAIILIGWSYYNTSQRLTTMSENETAVLSNTDSVSVVILRQNESAVIAVP